MFALQVGLCRGEVLDTLEERVMGGGVEVIIRLVTNLARALSVMALGLRLSLVLKMTWVMCCAGCERRKCAVSM